MKSKFSKLICISICFLALSCKKNLPEISLDQEFTLNFSESVMISDENTGKKFKLKFNDVVEDSRCPPGSYCIIAGEVKLELKIDNKEKYTITPMAIYNELPTPGQPTPTDTLGIVNYDKYKILLLNVDPVGAFLSNKPRSKMHYFAKFKVIK